MREDQCGRRHRVWASWLLILILTTVVLRVPLLQHRYFDTDEMQHLHAGYCIAHGMVPHRDFFEHHTPLFHFSLGALLLLFGETTGTIFVGRALMLACTVLILYLTYRLGCLLRNRDVGLIAALLLSLTIIFVEKTLEIRPDVPALVFVLLGLIWLIRGSRTGRVRWHFLGGAAWGVALMLTQKVVFALGGVLLALAWPLVDFRFPRVGYPTWRSIGLALAGVAAPVLMTLLYFGLAGGLDAFIEQNLWMNLSWKAKFWPYKYIRQLIRQNPVISVLGLAGWLYAARSLFRWARVRRGDAIPWAATLALLIGLYLIPVPFRQYFLLLLPLWAIYGAGLIWRISRIPAPREVPQRWRNPQQRTLIKLWIVGGGLIGWGLWRALSYSQPEIPIAGTNRYAWFWLAAALAGILGAWRLPERWRRRFVLGSALTMISAFPIKQTAVDQMDRRNYALLREIRYVLSHSAPDDSILTGWHGSGVFRPHAYFYWFLHGELQIMLSPAQRGADVVQAMRQQQPKLVEYDQWVKKLPLVVQQYIEVHYRPTGVGCLWVRKRPAP